MRYPAFPITDHLNRGHSTSPRGRRRHRGAWGLGSTSIGQEQEALTSTSFKYPGPDAARLTRPARRRVTKVAGAAVAQARVREWAAGSVARGSAARGTTGPAGFLCSNAPLVSLRLRSCATDEVDDQHDQENDDQTFRARCTWLTRYPNNHCPNMTTRRATGISAASRVRRSRASIWC